MEKQSRITPRHTWKLLLFYVVFTSLFSACQQEELIPDKMDEELEKVSFNFSFKNVIQTATDHQPMTRATGNDIVQLNGFAYILTEERSDGKYIVADVGTSRFVPTKKETHEISAGEIEDVTWESLLRPGNYRITIFTCVGCTEWNSEIQRGTIIDPDNPMWALQYTTPDTYYRDVEDCLTGQVFVGIQNFPVKKTQDLHSSGDVSFSVSLERRVAKFQDYFSAAPTAGGKVFTSDLGGIDANRMLTVFTYLTDVSGKGIPDGLDVFGDAYYDPLEKRTGLKILQTQWRLMDISSHFPYPLYISTFNEPVYAPYMFTDLKEPLQLRVTKVHAVAGPAAKPGSCIYHLYEGNENTYFIENNKTYGCIMQLTDNELTGYPADAFEIEPVIDIGGSWLDPSKWINPHYEYSFWW